MAKKQEKDKENEEETHQAEYRNKQFQTQQKIKEVSLNRIVERSRKINDLYQTMDRQLKSTLESTQFAEDILLKKQVIEGESKAALIFEENQKRRHDMIRDVERSRKQLMEERQKKAEEGKTAGKKERTQIEQMVVDMDEMEKAEKGEDRQRYNELRMFQTQQITQKKRKAEEEFSQQLNHDMHIVAMQDEQDKQFYSYAEKAIRQWQDHGKNIKPLIHELKSYKKRIH